MTYRVDIRVEPAASAGKWIGWVNLKAPMRDRPFVVRCTNIISDRFEARRQAKEIAITVAYVAAFHEGHEYYNSIPLTIDGEEADWI